MIGNRLTVEDIASQLEGKRVFLRADFNVPIKNGVVTDAFRIKSTVPTIDFLFASRAKAVICASHLGRPDGKIKPEYSLKQIVPELKRLTGREVMFLPDCVGSQTEGACKSAPQGSLILLENLRFHAAEEGSMIDADGKKQKAAPEDVENFRQSLSKLADVYVNDAFGTAHRAHSSMVGVRSDIRAAGKLMHKELLFMSKVLETPQRPFLAILGGAKITDKLPLLKNILPKADKVFVGGGMVFTLLKARQGMKIGNSLFDAQGESLVPMLFDELQGEKKFVLPCDFVAGDSFVETAKTQPATVESGIPDGFMGLDIGQKSIQTLLDAIKEAKTILINGPPGVFEWACFSQGSKALVEAIAAATAEGKVTVAGGGDTASMFSKFGSETSCSHVSTGGGASLELLEGKELPGVSALGTK